MYDDLLAFTSYAEVLHPTSLQREQLNSVSTIPHQRVCRFQDRGKDSPGLIGAVVGETVFDLSSSGITSLTEILEANNPSAVVQAATEAAARRVQLADVILLPPAERQEVWAAGVTYFRSKTARMEESDFSGTAYDRVYDAARPEIFFKSLGEKAVGPGDSLGIRADAQWSVPEPELALVMNSRQELVGVTIGNDMSSRDIEGENLLYLPQAKTYSRSCGLGPWIVLASQEDEIRTWGVTLTITRDGKTVFNGATGIDQLKRSFGELAGYLWQSQAFPAGVILLTGTGIVPDDSFTLAAEDIVTISIDGIGTLTNSIEVVGKPEATVG